MNARCQTHVGQPGPSAKARSAPSRARQKGVSLVELMISMAIGLLITAAMLSVFINLKQTYRQQEAFSRIQEAARYAFDRMGYDIRLAGTVGCYTTSTVNVLNTPLKWYDDLFNRPLMSYDDGAGGYPTEIASSVLRGDALTVVRADNSSNYIVDSHNPNSATIDLGVANKHDIKPGEILLITDCKHAAVFQMTGPTNTNNTAHTINHAKALGGEEPGNCTKGLGSPLLCTTNGTEYEFMKGSRIMRLKALTYFIGNNAAGEPSLYREMLGQSGGKASTSAEEIVEGIQDMQILYGVDTSVSADQSADTYVRADEVTTVAPGATDDDKWRRVISVRVSLLIRSTDNNVTTNAQKYKWKGNTVDAPDNRLRKVFTTTMTLRDRVL